MSQELKSVHVRLCDDAYEALRASAYIEDKDLAEMARAIMEQALLGRIHSVNLAVRRYARAGRKGIPGD